MDLLGNLRRIFADNIAAFRKNHAWTQHDLAAASGLAVHTIRGYEQQKAWPDPERVESLAHALGVLPEDFFKSQEQNTTLPAVELADAFGSVAKACAAAGLLTREDLESALRAVTSRKRA